MSQRREAMLRPEFQYWYPAIKAGSWYPADELTMLVRNHHRVGSPHWQPQGRIPSDEHFEYRGGAPREGPPRYTRWGERSPTRSDEPLEGPQLDS